MLVKQYSLALLTTCREPQGRAIGMMEIWNTGFQYSMPGGLTPGPKSIILNRHVSE
jgi:hypothetical protein